MKREVGPRHRNLHLFFISVSFDWFTILRLRSVISKRRGARENGLKIMDFRGLWSLSFITGLAMVEWLYLSCQARQPWRLRVGVKVLQNDVPRVVYLNFSRLDGDLIPLLHHFLLVWVYFLLPKEQQSCINVGQANTQDCANERGECVYPVVPESLNLFSLSACENISLEMLSS